MIVNVNMKKHVRDGVIKALNTKGKKGLSLSEILEETLITKDSSYVKAMMPVVYETLDELLDDGFVIWDDEKDIWTNVE